MALSLRNFKNLLTLHMECFFRIGNPTYFFFSFEKGRNYVSMIYIIVSIIKCIIN